MRKTTHSMRMTVVMDGLAIDQPPKDVKTLMPLPKLRAVESEGKAIGHAKVLDGMITD